MGKLRWDKAAGKNAELMGEAGKLAGEALEIADRCEYRLVQADVHNFMAVMAWGQGDKDKAGEEAAIAKERAWCDGPTHCYRKALDEAEEMLGKI